MHRIDTALPITDAALVETLNGVDSIQFQRESIALLEVVRVVRGAPGLKNLKVADLSMLNKSETDTFVYGQPDNLSYVSAPALVAHSLWDIERMRPLNLALERLDITGKFQPRCYRQMEWLVKGLLLNAHGLRELKLSMFEYPTNQFVAQMKKDVPMPTVVALPAMLGMDPKPSEEELQMELEGKMIGRMMAEAVLGHAPLCIEDTPTDLEAALETLFANASPPPQLRETEENHTVVKVTPSSNTVGTLLPRHPLFQVMTYEQYHDLMQTLYSTPLPETLEFLSMRVVLRGGEIQPRFLCLPCLGTLDLQHCEMDDAAFAIIGPTISRRMPSLRTLKLARNQLTDAQLGLMIGPELETLDCSFNPITSAAASHLFKAMEFNATLHEVDLTHTQIDRSVSFVGLNHWTASPAVLRIPAILSDDEIVEVSMYVHEGVEIEMTSPMGNGLRQAVKMLMH